MKITYNWLKQYIDLSDISVEKLVDSLTRGGLEVESTEAMAYATNLCIGKVLECIPHPDSDHLHVCKVDVGTDVRQIVCGAPNVAVGQKVIVALPGCKLNGGEIKEGVIRGQESKGMLCSLAELGVDKKKLSEAQLAGIEILSDDAKVGDKNVLEYLGLDDILLDVSLTPNRADCLSYWALGKETAAILNKEAKLPVVKYSCSKKASTLTIKSETEKCPYFLGTVINNITVKESPKWLKMALNAVGIKSINNIVDISNYVMLETGQPLHFYDLAKIPAKEITVKTGKNEKYTALDGIEYEIKEDDILITTKGNTIGIAGIMGGDDSKIDENTKGIIIEAALFNAVSIRNTSRRLGLDTDASVHFIKGIDPLAAEKATERSIQLLIELAQADNIEETVICGQNNYDEVKIEASIKQINRVLGTSFTLEQIYSTFERLDFKPNKVNDEAIEVTIPSYRTDIKLEEDLAEEVIRILGYENIVAKLPLMETIQGGLSENIKNKRIIKKMMNGYGFDEIISYSLVSSENVDNGILQIGTPVKIANELSAERRYYRTSLLPSMLDTIAYNVARDHNEYALFEVANVYSNEGLENQHLSLALSSISTTSSWQKLIVKNDFFTMKGIIIEILHKLGYEEKRIIFKPCENVKEMLHPNKSADVYINNKLVGRFGVVHPLVVRKYEIDACVVGELNLTDIYDQHPGKIKFNTVNKFPAVKYDLAMIVDDEVSANDIIMTIKKAGGTLLSSVSIFDVYKGSNIPEGKKSIAVSIEYQSNEKTLTENDIMPTHSGIIDALNVKLHASLRDN